MLWFVISGSQRGRSVSAEDCLSAGPPAEHPAPATVPAQRATSVSPSSRVRDANGQRGLQRGQVARFQGGVRWWTTLVKIVIYFLSSLYVIN